MQHTKRIAVNGEAIRAIRLRSNVSLRALADAAEISFSHLGYIERGESRTTLPVVSRIAEVLEVPIVAFLREEPQEVAS